MINPEARGTEGAFFSPELRDKIIEYLPAVALERGLITEIQYYVKDPDGVLTLGRCDDEEYTEDPAGCLKLRYVERYRVTPPIVELLVTELAAGVPLKDSILSQVPPLTEIMPEERSRAIQTDCVLDADTGEVLDYHQFEGVLNEHYLVVQTSEIEAAKHSSPEERLRESIFGKDAMQEAEEYYAGLACFDETNVEAMLGIFDRLV